MREGLYWFAFGVFIFACVLAFTIAIQAGSEPVKKSTIHLIDKDEVIKLTDSYKKHRAEGTLLSTADVEYFNLAEVTDLTHVPGGAKFAVIRGAHERDGVGEQCSILAVTDAKGRIIYCANGPLEKALLCPPLCSSDNLLTFK